MSDAHSGREASSAFSASTAATLTAGSTSGAAVTSLIWKKYLGSAAWTVASAATVAATANSEVAKSEPFMSPPRCLYTAPVRGAQVLNARNDLPIHDFHPQRG